jgi:hypothetical protein
MGLERFVENRIANYFKAEKTQCKCPTGVADLVSLTHVYEVKEWSLNKFKQALGQVLSYMDYFPNRRPAMIFYGDFNDYLKHKDSVLQQCRDRRVEIYFIKFNMMGFNASTNKIVFKE